MKSKESVIGLPELKDKFLNCEPCRLGKTKRKSFKPIGRTRSQRPLEHLHMDLCGPFPTQSHEGHKYFMTIIDDFSRKVTVYPIKTKDEAFDCFIRFQKRAERFLNNKILNVRTDNGLEFINLKFNSLFEEQGIFSERTNTYTPEQNGIAERFNYTAVDAIRTLLKDSGMPDKFWSEALLCFTYTWNRVCHGSQHKTPFELYGGRKPSIKHLKSFGTPAYVGTPKQLRRKLHMRAKRGTMMGYAMKTRGYRIWIPEDRKIVETINVTFDETKQPKIETQRLFTFINPYTEESEEETDCDGEAVEKAEKITPVSSESDSDGEVVRKTEKITPEISETDSSGETDDKTERIVPENSDTPKLREVVWIREAKPRQDKSRVDVYYRIEGEKARLRSYNDAVEYCRAHNIKYKRKFFNFSGKNEYSGIVKSGEECLNTSI